jgi:hypothetical protein
VAVDAEISRQHLRQELALVADAQITIEAWRVDYNTVRPHSALGGATPAQFVATSLGARRLSPPRPDEEKNPETLTLSV